MMGLSRKSWSETFQISSPTYRGRTLALTLACASVAALSSCGSAKLSDEDKEEIKAELQLENQKQKDQLAKISKQLDVLQENFKVMNEKINSTQTTLDNFFHVKKSRARGVKPLSGGNRGIPADPTSRHRRDPEGKLGNTAGVQEYRAALILFKGANYSDSILKFSSFLKKFPDHALAGSAQFYVGESYFLQNEFKLAVKELSRVLVSYERSSHISDTLKRLVESEERLKLTQKADKHRQLLLTLFPQSPAAQEMMGSGVQKIRKADAKNYEKRRQKRNGVLKETPASAPVKTAAPQKSKKTKTQ